MKFTKSWGDQSPEFRAEELLDFLLINFEIDSQILTDVT